MIKYSPINNGVPSPAKPKFVWSDIFTVIGGMFLYFWCWGGFYAFSTQLNAITESLGTHYGHTGWIASCYPASLQFVSFFTGWLCRRFSPRPVVVCGAILQAAAYLSSSFVYDFKLMTVTFGVLGGIGASCMAVGGITVVGQKFTKRRNVAMGFVTAGSGLGSLVLAPAYHAVTTSYSWRQTFRGAAALSLLMNLTAVIMLGPPRAGAKKKVAAFDLKYLKDPVMIILMAAMPFMYYGYWVFNVYLTPFGIYMGMDSGQAAWLVAGFGVINTIARVASGRILDAKWMNASTLYAWSVFFKGVLTIVLPFMAPWKLGVWIVTVLCAALSAGGLMLPNVAAAEFPVHMISVVMGTAYSVASPGSAVGSPLSGILIQQDGYRKAFAIGGGCLIMASLILSFLPVANRRKRIFIDEAENSPRENAKGETEVFLKK